MTTQESDRPVRKKTGIRSPGPWHDIDRPRKSFTGPLVHEITVGWGDCDPAQIAYTANIPAWGIEAIEAWYRHCLGAGWYELNLRHGIGTPFVSLGFDFKSPVTPMHVLQVCVEVTRIGNSSLSHAVTGKQEDMLCFTGQTTATFVEAAAMSPLRIPPNIRQSIESYRSAQDH